MTSIPYVLGVKVNKSDASARANVTVKITNIRTSETMTNTTNSSGETIFDLANFIQGYETGDVIDVEKQVANSDVGWVFHRSLFLSK